MALNSGDISLRHEEALATLADAERALDQRRAAAVVLDEDGGPEEAAAVETVRKAREAAERLEGALTAVLQAEAAERRRLAAADRDAQDARTIAVAETMEKAAHAFDTAAEKYVNAYARLLDAAQATQAEIAQRQGVLRRDLSVPPLDGHIGRYLSKLAGVTPRLPPGAVSTLHGRDSTPSLSDVLGSLTAAIRTDIEASRTPAPANW